MSDVKRYTLTTGIPAGAASLKAGSKVVAGSDYDALVAERDQLRAELEAIRGQQPDTWPTLDKPAKVGAVLFNPGLSARLVVEAAQRQHEYSQQPEVEAERLERFKRAMREFHGEPDAVSVPRELLERISLSRPFESARYQAIDELRALLSTKNAEEWV
ncbi:hypothetical protein ACUYGA_16930 [Metapseudomonas otitidis]|uniref:hypothetical protein n=1 Tax=Metapseudomonas otitidis TaxID=319939 RepID=UPI0040558A92